VCVRRRIVTTERRKRTVIEATVCGVVFIIISGLTLEKPVRFSRSCYRVLRTRHGVYEPCPNPAAASQKPHTGSPKAEQTRQRKVPITTTGSLSITKTKIRTNIAEKVIALSPHLTKHTNTCVSSQDDYPTKQH
jgi:hypothetical protein